MPGDWSFTFLNKNETQNENTGNLLTLEQGPPIDSHWLSYLLELIEYSSPLRRR